MKKLIEQARRGAEKMDKLLNKHNPDDELYYVSIRKDLASENTTLFKVYAADPKDALNKISLLYHTAGKSCENLCCSIRKVD